MKTATEVAKQAKVAHERLTPLTASEVVERITGKHVTQKIKNGNVFWVDDRGRVVYPPVELLGGTPNE